MAREAKADLQHKIENLEIVLKTQADHITEKESQIILKNLEIDRLRYQGNL